MNVLKITLIIHVFGYMCLSLQHDSYVYMYFQLAYFLLQSLLLVLNLLHSYS